MPCFTLTTTPSCLYSLSMPYQQVTCPWPGHAAAVPQLGLHQKWHCSKPQFYIDSSEQVTNYLPHLSQTIILLFPLAKLGGSGGELWVVSWLFSQMWQEGEERKKNTKEKRFYCLLSWSPKYPGSSHTATAVLIPVSPMPLFLIKSPLYTNRITEITE